MTIHLDPDSGFCFGVIRAIEKAEQLLDSGIALYSLGEIVHNSVEVNRLKEKGLRIIDREQMEHLHNATVLIRAHGEPPDTYALAKRNQITLIDATCPVVLHLQSRIGESYRSIRQRGGQLVIFGRRGHAEVNGLVGQANGDATVVESVDEVARLDLTRSITLYSQTTKSLEHFARLQAEIRRRLPPNLTLDAHDTVCRQVSHRKPHLRELAKAHDVIIFVSGRNSSNGQELFQACAEANPRSYLVQDTADLQPAWFHGCRSVGICGATSTPKWLMEQIAAALREMKNCLEPGF